MAAFIRIGLLVLSWLTVLNLPKKSYKKYLPIVSMATIIVLIQSLVSGLLKLLTVKEGMKEKIFNDLSILGPFFMGAIWIFTFRKFLLYLFVNVVINYLHAYSICNILQRLKQLQTDI
jgi:hypothetical protein